MTRTTTKAVGWLWLAGAIGATTMTAAAAPPELVKRPIFEAEAKHNHASCISETPRGDLLAVWYSGTGERKADDVVIQAAWMAKGADSWSPRFQTADTPGYPDCNPALLTAPDGRVWMFWPTILDHRWESALLKYSVADPSQGPPGPIRWESSNVLHITPESGQFEKAIAASVAQLTDEERTKYAKELEPFTARSTDLLYQRLGWMPRVRGIVLPSGRWILPLYCDTFSLSLMGISDDQGKTWTASDLTVGFGAIQPTIVRKNDGGLVAYFRDNGPHNKIRMATSPDEGKSWTDVVDTPLPNPGAGIEAIRLESGAWAMVYNDLPRGRHSLAVSLSDDEGATWPITRHVELDEPGSSFHYPSMTQARDGAIHLSYTHSLGLGAGTAKKSTIMHATFPEAWVRQGD
ncbi:sialidase family protein [Planctomyces sp. SH-PL62]|uniref:sialidase family protein n=1 Tax=Planctomyces sp. SH-PL62 TaxID=1636152 RepID=UPI00078D19DE|nr:exo-alpha-sialidase [Planctomyces sp. SH-PL62]AMV37307.1 Sialidase precursor [Planctomyces sp. SH-PL62]